MRKIIAFILLICFLLFSVSATVFYSVSQTFFNRDFYDDRFIDKLYNFSVSRFVAEVDLKAYPTLNKDQFEKLIRESISKEDFLVMIDEVFTEFGQMRLDEENFSFSIPFNGVLNQTDKLTNTLSLYLYENLPDCTDEELSNFNEFNVSCKPKTLVQEDFEAIIKSSLDREVFAKFQTDFTFTITTQQSISGNLSELVSGAKSAFVYFALGFSFLFLFLIGLIIFRPVSSIVKWQGTALLIYSFILLIIAFVTSKLPGFLSHVNTETSGGSFTSFEIDSILSISESLINGFSGFVTIFSLPFLVGSVLCLIFGFYLERKA